MRITALSRAVKNRREAASMRACQRRHDERGAVEFIHINKTGGSSVEQALALPFHHQTARDRIALLGRDEWDRRFSFTFVRNPWDKVVSQYHFRKGRDRLRGDLTFPEWVEATLVERDQDLMFRRQMFADQVDWISDRDGAVAVDAVYRYELLREDFARLCDRLGVRAELQHRKPSQHRHYSSYYDDHSEVLVAEAFQRDITMFGYHFERHDDGRRHG